MLKFLRKYNRWILVVGGAFLMVAFLLPQTLSELGRGIGSRTTYMKVDGERVSALDAEEGRHELYALQEVGLWPKGEPLERWILMTREASKAGLVGGAQDGREAMEEVADERTMEMVRQYSFLFQGPEGRKQVEQMRERALAELEAARASMSRQSGVGAETFDTALAKLRGVARLQALYRGAAAEVSDRRAIAEGRRLLDEAKIDYVFVPGDRASAPIPEPDDAALQALFEQFKSVKQGQGQYGLGYTLPPRVKVEWLTLDRSAWDKEVQVDPLEVRNRYLRDNKGKAASGPEFEAARPGIESQIRKETLDRLMSDASQVVRTEIAKATVKLGKSGEYYALPADWAQRKPDFNAIQGLVAAKLKADGIEPPPPTVTVKDAEWLSDQDLTKLPGIGRAGVRRGRTTMGFAELVSKTKELGGDPNTLGLQARVPYGQPLEDSEGNQYFFTILDARPESPPGSWQEIREQLVKDYKRLEGYKALEKDAAAYTQRAIAGGLDSLTKDQPAAGSADQPLKVQTGTVVTRSRRLAPEIDTEAFKNAVVTAAEGLDPTVSVDLFDATKRFLSVPVPEKLGLAVVKITGYTPMSVEKYRANEQSLVMRIQSDTLKGMGDEPFSLKRLKERYHVEMGKGQKGEDDEKKGADEGN